MRKLRSIALLWGAIVLISYAARAQTPREQLAQMVEQLQTVAHDDSLRVDVIKLALTLDPPPALPEEAERRMTRGTAAFKGATSPTDYAVAAAEFEQATMAAPWYGDAYFNLGTAQDKAEKYSDALRSLKLASLASPNDKAIKLLLYEVEFRSEQHSPAAEAARMAALQKDKDEAVFQQCLGRRYFVTDEVIETSGGPQSYRCEMEIGSNEIIYIIKTKPLRNTAYATEISREACTRTGRRLVYDHISIGPFGECHCFFEVTADGRYIQTGYILMDGTEKVGNIYPLLGQ